MELKIEKLLQPRNPGSSKMLKNPIVMAPMTTFSGNLDGTISEAELKYYKVRSKGVGMVITATTYVSPSGKGFPDALWNTIINTPGWFPIGQVGNIE